MSGERFAFRAAVYLLLISEGKLLLSKRKNTGWMDDKYTLVSGHMEGNETVIDAMIREAKEEIGVDISRDDLKVVGVMHRMSNVEYIDFYLEVSKWKGEIINMEPEKCEGVEWFPLDNLPADLIPEMKQKVKNILNKQFFSEAGF